MDENTRRYQANRAACQKLIEESRELIDRSRRWLAEYQRSVAQERQWRRLKSPEKMKRDF